MTCVRLAELCIELVRTNTIVVEASAHLPALKLKLSRYIGQMWVGSLTVALVGQFVVNLPSIGVHVLGQCSPCSEVGQELSLNLYFLTETEFFTHVNVTIDS